MDKLIYVVVATLAVQLGNGSPLAGSKDDASRIIDGSPAEESDYPFAASMQLKSQGSQPRRGHTCGGALISLRHVVTSGNCLYMDTSPYTLKREADYRVFAGAVTLTEDASVTRWKDIEQITPHPDYEGPISTLNDIGIITLVSEFAQSAALAPVSLAATEPAQRTHCVTVGWGDTSTSEQQEISVQLHHVSRYVMHPVSCAELVKWAGGPDYVPAHAMCGGHVDIFTPSCTGDNGNALVCDGAIVGVLSWHPACSIYHNVEQYTRTTSFLDWIEQVTDVEPQPPVESGEESEESEEEEGDPGAAPSAPALAALLLSLSTLTHFLYRGVLLNLL